MQIDWYIPTNNRNYNRVPASIWIRCYQLIPYLEELGIRSTINDKNSNGDIAILLRMQGNEDAISLARQQKQKGKKVVIDLVTNSLEPTATNLQRDFGIMPEDQVTWTHQILDVADAVSCASKYIQEQAQKYHPNVYYLSDSIDTRHFRHIKSDWDLSKNSIKVIWSGVSVKSTELEPLFPLLKKYQLSLVAITDKPLPWMKSRFWQTNRIAQFVKWNYRTFPSKIISGDVAISYRSINDSYNLGHSLFKIGVFMAQGVPAICVPQPSYREVIVNNTGGRICSTIEEWDEAFSNIRENPQLVKQWSTEALDNIEPYLTKNIVQQYATMFRHIISK